MKPFAAMRLRKPAAGGGAWVTINNQAPSGYETGWNGFTQRQRFGSALVVAGTKIRLTAAANTAQVGAMYVGIGATSGDNYDFAATPVQVTFSGSGSVSIGATSQVLSDEIPLTIASGDAILVASYFSGTSTVMAQAGLTNRNSYYKTGNDASTVDASGYSTSANPLHLFSKVEIWQP